MSFSCWFIAYFHFLAERKLKISDVSSRNRTRKTIFVKDKIYSKVQDRAKEWGFIWQSRKLELQRTQFFFRNFVCYTKSCLKGFNFPAKKLIIRMRQFFSIYSVSNIRLKWLHFPAKKLRKNTCAVFFLQVCFRLHLLLMLYFYLMEWKSINSRIFLCDIYFLA